MTYLSTFYRRTDLGKRVAFYFSATSLAGAFSGLLAAGLLHMDGLAGKRGWAWIFIIEGLFTVVCGALTFVALPRTPETAWYLSPDERVALVRALDIDRPKAQDEEPLTLRAILSALKAPQAWLMFLQFFSSGCMLFSIAYCECSSAPLVPSRGTDSNGGPIKRKMRQWRMVAVAGLKVEADWPVGRR